MPDRDEIRRVPVGRRGPARHEMPAVDEAALTAARAADRVVAAVEERGVTRWIRYFEAMPDHLRDDDPNGLRQVTRRARAAYGPKDSIRDVIPEDVTETFLDAIDRLIKQLNRRDVGAA